MNLANAPFLEDLYKEWQKDPGSVSADWAAYFTNLGDPAAPAENTTETISSMGIVQFFVIALRNSSTYARPNVFPSAIMPLLTTFSPEIGPETELASGSIEPAPCRHWLMVS